MNCFKLPVVTVVAGCCMPPPTPARPADPPCFLRMVNKGVHKISRKFHNILKVAATVQYGPLDIELQKHQKPLNLHSWENHLTLFRYTDIY